MLKRYITLSIVLHIAIFLFFFFTIKSEQKKELTRTPLIARIITPDKTLPPPTGAPAPSAPAPQPPLTAPEPVSPPETAQAPAPPEPPPPPARDVKMLPKPPEKKPLPPKEKRQPPVKTPKPKVEKPRPQKPPKEDAIPAQMEKPEPDEPPAKAPAPSRASAAPGAKESSKVPPNLMGKLFDTDIIRRHANESLKKKETSNKKADIDDGDVVTFDVDDMKYRNYLRRLRESIESVWVYPEAEARRGIYGDLYISFTISKNGTLASVRVLRTSGHRSLDEAAVKALRDASPFWPLPTDWGRDTFTIQGHFVYSYLGSRIR